MRVKAAEQKNNPSHYLKLLAQTGEPITLLDRNHPRRYLAWDWRIASREIISTNAINQSVTYLDVLETSTN